MLIGEWFCSCYLSIYTGILRYLGGRFPETTSAVDENGRTALHYAATIKDNGHFYNLLVHLGSNPNTIDKVVICLSIQSFFCCGQLIPRTSQKQQQFQLGHNTEFYLEHDKSEKILSHAELLRSFGVAGTAANGMLNDQGYFFLFTFK